MDNMEISSESCTNKTPAWSRRALAVAWLVLRLPLLFVFLFLLRYQLSSLVFGVVGLGRATLFVINVLSTPVSRVLYFGGSSIILMLCAIFTQYRTPRSAYFLMIGTGLVIFVAACFATSRSVLFALPAVLLLATNLSPSNLSVVAFSTRSRRWLLFWAVGVSEVFFFWRHASAVCSQNADARFSDMPRWRWASPGIVVASAASALFLNGGALVPFEQAIRKPPSVRVVVNDLDVNWIQADNTQNHLLVVGHGLNHVRRYNLEDWSSPPTESVVTITPAQGFAYDPLAHELYIQDPSNEKLLYFDSQSLVLKRSTDLKNLSPGDTWLAFDPKTQTIAISSEADEETGTPFVLVDRSSGEILDRQNEEAGSLLLDFEQIDRLSKLLSSHSRSTDL